MGQLSVKGKGSKIELCFSECTSPSDALEQVKLKSSFLKNSQSLISYSGIGFSYNEEMLFEKSLKELLGEGISLEKKRRLSKSQIEYSLNKDERLTLVINKSLRSGEVAESRGDILIYGDVNPGALVKAQGNITIIGALRGAAHITGSGRVYATYMQPSQIKIGKVCSYNKKTENVGCAAAIAENGEIILQCL